MNSFQSQRWFDRLSVASSPGLARRTLFTPFRQVRKVTILTVIVLAFIRQLCGNALGLFSRPSGPDKGVWYAVQATLGEEPGTQGLAFVQLAANHGGCLFRF